MKKHIITVTGPSLSGKTEFTKSMIDKFNYNLIVSTTTRPKRSNEIEGIDFNFVTKKEYDDLSFIQKTYFNNNYYGVSEKELLSKINKPVLWVIAPESLSQVENYCNKNNILLTKIFITNPKEVIFTRLFNRFKNDSLADTKTYVNRLLSIVDKENQWNDDAFNKVINYELIFKEFNENNREQVLLESYNFIINKQNYKLKPF